MFTGIVETVGEVVEFHSLDRTESGGNGTSVVVSAPGILEDCHLGDSIAINGVCLTVTEFDRTVFKVGIAPETLRRTNLGTLEPKSKVNCERAVSGHVRFGGHFVQGHVDTIAEIVEKKPDENALTLTFQLRDPQYMKYIVEKGFIAIDGTSLTVTAVNDSKAQFSVMLIAFTQEKVIIAAKNVGDQVNIEVDLMGKLVEKQISSLLEKQTESGLSSLVSRLIDEKLEKKN